MSVADMRKEYRRGDLSEAATDADPVRQFAAWFADARDAGLVEPNAMTLATADEHGRPSARVVLLKGFDERGFVFVGNYDSRKGAELAANPHAALVFYWAELERQVRVEGAVGRVEPAESDEYFRSRPLASRLGALASPQSRVVESRELLEENYRRLLEQYAAGDVPRPDHWGGYRLVPAVVEFWQGRPSRMHDRICYRRAPDGAWEKVRLAP